MMTRLLAAIRTYWTQFIESLYLPFFGIQRPPDEDWYWRPAAAMRVTNVTEIGYEEKE